MNVKISFDVYPDTTPAGNSDSNYSVVVMSVNNWHWMAESYWRHEPQMQSRMVQFAWAGITRATKFPKEITQTLGVDPTALIESLERITCMDYPEPAYHKNIRWHNEKSS